MMLDGDNMQCRVFGYFASFDEGPVRTLEAQHLGSADVLHEAERIVRRTEYRYDFFVIEYCSPEGTYSRYYDSHRLCRFVSCRTVGVASGR
jgi:hypothetical protein